MTWWKSLVVVTICFCLVALVFAAIFTGRDIPLNLAGLLGTALGLCLAGDGVAMHFIEKRRK